MKITREKFDALFDEVVRSPLEERGFKSMGKGLYYEKDLIQVALIRGVGRMSLADGISQIIACRHSFLREETNLSVPDKQPFHPEDYVYVFAPNEAFVDVSINLRFSQEAHMHLPYEKYIYADKTETEVISYLVSLRKVLIQLIVSTFSTISLQEMEKDLEKHKKDFWLAQLWYEDYKKYNHK